MAKQRSDGGKDGLYPYPSRFGSHASMVEKELTNDLFEGKVSLDERQKRRFGDASLVVCRDEFGEYITEAVRLDDRSADPNRHSRMTLPWNQEGSGEAKEEGGKRKKPPRPRRKVK